MLLSGVHTAKHLGVQKKQVLIRRACRREQHQFNVSSFFHRYLRSYRTGNALELKKDQPLNDVSGIVALYSLNHKKHTTRCVDMVQSSEWQTQPPSYFKEMTVISKHLTKRNKNRSNFGGLGLICTVYAGKCDLST
jgi:hypothetical protein